MCIRDRNNRERIVGSGIQVVTIYAVVSITHVIVDAVEVFTYYSSCLLYTSSARKACPAEPDSYPADADTGRCKQEVPQVAAFTRMNR